MSEDRFRLRAWDTGCEYMIEFAADYYLDDDLNTLTFGAALNHYVAGDHDDGTRFKLMQCTGLRDKNGTLIWEGDILKCELYDDCGYDTGKYFNTVVKWREASFEYLEWIPINSTIIGDHNIEVIGNVFEHPELLEETHEI